MGRALTPEDLTFHSFRHSQGSESAQLHFLHAIEYNTGIAPSFTPDEKTLQRYARFLHAAPATHRRVLANSSETGLEGEVMPALNSISTGYKVHTDGCTAPAKDVLNFADYVIKKESSILKPDGDWLRNDYLAPPYAGMYERIKQRVVSGRSSQLLLYGRDGKPTGYEAFDDLYRQAWEVMGSPENTQQFTGTIALLEQYVTAAEQHFLGRTILGNADAAPELVETGS